jgi:hypothetical protein
MPESLDTKLRLLQNRNDTQAYLQHERRIQAAWLRHERRNVFLYAQPANQSSKGRNLENPYWDD